MPMRKGQRTTTARVIGGLRHKVFSTEAVSRQSGRITRGNDRAVHETIPTIATFFAVVIGVPLLGLLGATLIESARSDDLRKRLGVDKLYLIPFLVAAVLWAVIALVLFVGLVTLILDVLNETTPKPKDDPALWEFRFKLVQITALTTVLGAVVALPITMSRLRLTRKQTETATESLFNDKINAATKGLYARRQVTKAVAPGGSYKLHQDFWQDDIVQRCAAIDRLEGLAKEKPTEVPRIARLLSVYVRELGDEVPAVTPPGDATPDELGEWAYALPKLRSDMEKAAQTLGRLAKIETVMLEDGEIDLRGANLQRADLNGLKFEKALLSGARLQGANLSQAHLQKADLVGAQMHGVNAFKAHLQGSNLEKAQLQGANCHNTYFGGANMLRADLQGAELDNAQMQHSNLWRAKMQAAILFQAQMQGCDLTNVRTNPQTSFSEAVLKGACVGGMDFAVLKDSSSSLEDVFGHKKMVLPDDVSYPEHWAEGYTLFSEFRKQWRAWQATLSAGWDQPEE